jgi:hypothetical protein
MNSNACGTVALLHAVANNRETIGLKEGALMVRILFSLSLSRGHTFSRPYHRGLLICCTSTEA